MTKSEKIYHHLNEKFREVLPAEFLKRFKKKLVTEWSIFQTCLISRPEKGKFTKKEKAFVEAYSEGYAAAMNEVQS